jgi:ferredoxin
MSDVTERKISNLRVVIERSTCIGSENCIKSAPKLFILDSERYCSFLEPVEEDDKDKIIEACSVCPVNALYVYDDKGKQIVP